MVLEAEQKSIHPLLGSDAASERYRQLMYNSLMKKNERLDYVPELAESAQPAPDGLSVTLTLRDGVKFHSGKPLTSADVKYTFDQLLRPDSPSPKSPSFFEGTGDARQPFITAVEAPDARTVVFRLRKPWLELYANMLPVGIIPEGSFETLEQAPDGTGPFKFVAQNRGERSVDMAAHEEYWEGAPNVKQLRVRVILDAGTQQAELQSGQAQLALNTALTPDAVVALGRSPNLKVEQSPGANIQYLGINTEAEPLNDVRVRRAVAHAIDRESLIKNLLQGQARVAHSMLPPESWAYAEGQVYNFDPAQAKRLLDEAGLRDPDGDGPRARATKPIVMKISATNAVARQSAGVIQNALKDVGLNVSIETLEDNTLREQLVNGQYHLTIGRWVGGNQDPIFLRDLFTFLTGKGNYRFNRSRYSNPEVDKLLGEAVNTADRARAAELYRRAQEIISRDVPTLPLWYPNNIAIAQNTVGNINVDPSADWRFMRSVTWQR
ncbi:MAG TPA: ABC transporter substrate-binding protein [Pyrinomonadaceae bacterium]|nr:ABC transporter substrate-binding protein [Pyrinomonadaceae bacterium]